MAQLVLPGCRDVAGSVVLIKPCSILKYLKNLCLNHILENISMNPIVQPLRGSRAYGNVLVRLCCASAERLSNG